MLPLSKAWFASTSLLILFLSAAPAGAQDMIITLSRRISDVQVLSVGRKRVFYNRVSGGDTEQHSRSLRFVRRVTYGDGSSWPPPVYLRREEERQFAESQALRINRKRNLIYGFAPAVQLIGNSGGIAAGLGYERRLGQKSRISVGGFLTTYATTTVFGKKFGPSTHLDGYYAAASMDFHFPRIKRWLDISLGLDAPVGVINRTDELFDSSAYLGSRHRKYQLLALEGVFAARLFTSRSFTAMLRAAGGPVLNNNAPYKGLFRAAFCLGFRR